MHIMQTRIMTHTHTQRLEKAFYIATNKNKEGQWRLVTALLPLTVILKGSSVQQQVTTAGYEVRDNKRKRCSSAQVEGSSLK